MGNTPFKMKGSPMQRNFGIGSPLHDDNKKNQFTSCLVVYFGIGSPLRDEKDKIVQGGTTPTIEVSGGQGGKSAATRAYEARLETQAAEEMARGSVKGTTPKENYKTAYANLSESEKVKFRAAAQKRAEGL